jgi:hypothetical protein
MKAASNSRDSRSDAHPPEIRQRSFNYALRAIKLYQHLRRQKDDAGRVLGKQYLP